MSEYNYDVEVKGKDEIHTEVLKIRDELEACDDRNRRKRLLKDIDKLLTRLNDEKYKESILKELSYEYRSHLTGL